MILTGKRVLFQGDSITDGNRYKDVGSRWDKNHQIGHSYAYILAGVLGLAYAGEHVEFVNRGVSGDGVSRLAARWQADTLEEKPDLLSILVGINDTHSFRDPDPAVPEMYGSTLRDLLTQARAANPALQIVIMEPFCEPTGEESALRRKMLPPIQAAAKKLAEEFGATFIPLQQLFDELCRTREMTYWTWDGVHPTEAGHAVIAREWIRTVLGEEGASLCEWMA